MVDRGNSPGDNDQMIGGDAGSELASNRTAIAFVRTVLAADRTLMAVIRTALALIGFGFTIFQFFHTLRNEFLQGILPAEAPRRFGLALVMLGLTVLVLGMIDHVRQVRDLDRQRQHLTDLGIAHRIKPVRVSTAMVTALMLFVLGLLAVGRIAFSVGPL